MDNEWRQIEQGYLQTCEKVLGPAKANSNEWISKETGKINYYERSQKMLRTWQGRVCQGRMRVKSVQVKGG